MSIVKTLQCVVMYSKRGEGRILHLKKYSRSNAILIFYTDNNAIIFENQ